MNITAAQVKTLREKSGAGMMDCKRALTETGGDAVAALALLREQGTSKAEKRQGRAAQEGVVTLEIAGDQAVLVELNCETDFVARNDEFRDAARQLAQFAVGITPAPDSETLLSQVMDGQSIAEHLTGWAAKMGENVALGKVVSITKPGPGHLVGYVHTGDQLAVVMDLGTSASESPEIAELGRNLSMHTAASNPDSISRDDMPQELVAAEADIFEKQAFSEGKPEKIVDRIVEGRMGKFFEERCLLEQEYVRDPDLAVKDVVEAAGKEVGEPIDVRGFVRVKVGEQQD